MMLIASVMMMITTKRRGRAYLAGRGVVGAL